MEIITEDPVSPKRVQEVGKLIVPIIDDIHEYESIEPVQPAIPVEPIIANIQASDTLDKILNVIIRKSTIQINSSTYNVDTVSKESECTIYNFAVDIINYARIEDYLGGIVVDTKKHPKVYLLDLYKRRFKEYEILNLNSETIPKKNDYRMLKIAINGFFNKYKFIIFDVPIRYTKPGGTITIITGNRKRSFTLKKLTLNKYRDDIVEFYNEYGTYSMIMLKNSSSEYMAVDLNGTFCELISAQ
jgi:hypothetical protein